MAPNLLTAPVSSADPLTSGLTGDIERLTSADSSFSDTESDTFTVTMRPDAPDWFWNAVDEIVNLLALPAGWDSYGSPAISKAIAISAMQLLGRVASATIPRPDVIPTSAGGIAFEWSTLDHTLEVDIFAPGRGHLYHEDLRTRAGDDLEFSDASVLEKFLATISR